MDSVRIEYDKGNKTLQIKYIPNLENNIQFISITPEAIKQYLGKTKSKDEIDEIILEKQEEKIKIYFFKIKVEIIGADYNEIVNDNNTKQIQTKFELCKFSHSIRFSVTNNFICIFEDNVEFKFCNFEQEVILSQCIFKKI
ncbi:hypothetical protein [Helicobacter sp. MIT 14-3879]|uniref:hypothetical protein n=1 Tax=Helicobacter sp. MIT 14-3879 TaxID=2040649 RepID=UPI000E1F43D7|nr:hypothetical protein [Helicobacter sp. MIT 14-3879]RDU62676.1 hypothetical protein CQA44_06730 [Helicobacter sp. MIT 14-3879]